MVAFGDEFIRLANFIYGQASGEDFNTMVMVGSSALNRLDTGEFGISLNSVIDGFGNEGKYEEAVNQEFPSKEAENEYKKAIQVASGLIRGTIDPVKGTHFKTDKEVRKNKKEKNFDFKSVKKVGKTGKYNVYTL